MPDSVRSKRPWGEGEDMFGSNSRWKSWRLPQPNGRYSVGDPPADGCSCRWTLCVDERIE